MSLRSLSAVPGPDTPLILSGCPTRVHAHVGDEIYFFYELRDDDLERIDLDGSVDDWLGVVGEPSLTASDFFWRNHPYDPSEVDFRIWLAWHQGSSTLWIAMERFDDLYFNLYDGEKPWEMQLWDSSLRFLVDGDHSGGEYSYLLGWQCQECTADQSWRTTVRRRLDGDRRDARRRASVP